MTSTLLVKRTLATLRSAELGFFGVVVYTRVHTPRRWGLPLSAGVLVLPTLSSRQLRTRCWLLVPASGRPPPALGRVARRPQDRAPAKLTGEVRRRRARRLAEPVPPW